jgi:hypothetical protein
MGHLVALPPEWEVPMIKFLEQERNRAFDPDAVRIMSAAFEGALQSLQTSKAGVTSRDGTEAIREILANHIIEMAWLGVRDQRQLRESALHQLAEVTLRHVPRYDW